MQFVGINLLAVLAAAAASFVFGAVYYMSLAKPWMAAVGKTEAEIKQDASPIPYIVAAVAQFVMAYMVAAILNALAPTQATVAAGLAAGFYAWIGFVVTTVAVNNAFRGAKRSLTVIDSGHWLGGLLIQGLVLSLIGV